MIPQNFIWSDGPRPTNQAEVEEYVGLSSLLNLDVEILQLQDPTNNQRWEDAPLLVTSQLLQKLGIRVHWMLWAKTDPEFCRQQITYLDNLFTRFIPNGVQFDAEEQWDPNGPYQECAQILNDGLKMLNEKYGVSPEYSITATTLWPQPAFAPHIEYLISIEMITHGYAMAYAFYNPADGHWSHDLPKDVTQTVRLISIPWIDLVKRGVLQGCSIGLAAHFQNFPPDYEIDGLDGMMQCIGEVYTLSDENPNCILGQGWWSRKHVASNEDKQTVIYNASQDPRSGRPLTPLPTPPYNPIYELQRVLKEAGYDPGPLDGKDGPKTRAAVAQYEEEKARVIAAQDGGADELIEEIYGSS